MSIKIKEYIGALEEREKLKEQKAYKKNKKLVRSTKMPKSFFDYPIYQELYDVIICKEGTRVIPRKWDELEINFKDRTVRYCTMCDEKVYKVSNIHNYNEIKNRNLTIAVPINSDLFKNIYNDFKEQIDQFVFVQISRQLIQVNGYDESSDVNSCKALDEIKFILSFLISKDWINYQSWVVKYLEFDINLNEFLYDIGQYFQNKELLRLITGFKSNR